MKHYELESPYCMSKKKWAELSKEEQDRAILTWLIVIKLSDAPTARLERALLQLQ